VLVRARLPSDELRRFAPYLVADAAVDGGGAVRPASTAT
jgi:hypothetical protein